MGGKGSGRKLQDEKKCRCCGFTKPRSEFTRVTGLPNAVHSNCKKCNADLARTRYNKKPKQDTATINRRSKIKRKYGISLDDYDAMLRSQDGKCAICGTDTPTGKAGQLGPVFHVDHCHKYGQIRGLLCHKCNTALGNFGDDIGVLKRAISYLERAMS